MRELNTIQKREKLNRVYAVDELCFLLDHCYLIHAASSNQFQFKATPHKDRLKA